MTTEKGNTIYHTISLSRKVFDRAQELRGPNPRRARATWDEIIAAGVKALWLPIMGVEIFEEWED